MILAPCPSCGSVCYIWKGLGLSYYVSCSCCEYHSPFGVPKEKAIAAHNALCACLDAAAAMAEALEPLAREADNWLPEVPDDKWIGHSNVIGSTLSEYVPITVGHARAAQRALARFRAATAHDATKEPS